MAKKVTVGYWYSLGIHMGMCHPVDALLELRAADRTFWSGSITSNTSVSISQSELFGGEKKEGGIQGTLDVMMGAPAQGANSYLTSIQGGVQSAYRGILGLVFRGRITANNPYIKPWAARVRRITADWDGGTVWNSTKASIDMGGGLMGMNPAHIIYQTLTDRRRGKGLSAGRLDLDTFVTAADVFHGEGMGLCFTWNKPAAIETFIQRVCDHAGAAVGEDPSTGLIRLTAIRDDYDIGDLQVFSRAAGNVIEVEAFDRAAATGTTNEVTVRYMDQALGKMGSATVQHLASIQAQGLVTATTTNYEGFPTAALALRAAMRDLQSYTAGLARVRLRCTRAAFGSLPGDVIAFSEPRYGIDLMPLRIGKANYGSLTNGEIIIEAVQDVFGLPETTYVDPQGPIWVPPSSIAQPPPYVHAIEMPYRELVQEMGADDAAALDSDTGYLASMAARPTGVSINYQLETRIDPAEFEQAADGDWTPHGTLDAAIGKTDTSITITGVDLDLVEVGTTALLGTTPGTEEIVRVEAIDAGTGAVTIARGCLDTVPHDFASGTRIWFYDNYSGADPTEYAQGEEVDAMFRTRTSSGLLDAVDSPTDAVLMLHRQVRPYPPGNLQINSTSYPTSVSAAMLTVTWSHRDRLLQQDQIIDTLAGDIGPEASTTYTVRYIDTTGVDTLLQENTGITGTSDSYTPPGGVSRMRVEVEAVRSSLLSWQANTHEFDYDDGSGGWSTDAVLIFYADGVWTKPPGLTALSVVAVAAGAGGLPGLIETYPTGSYPSRGGGGGGGRSVKSFDSGEIAALASSVSIVVGTGGAEGAAGGDSSFGTDVVATGGSPSTTGGTNGAGGVQVTPTPSGSDNTGGVGSVASSGGSSVNAAGGGGRGGAIASAGAGYVAKEGGSSSVAAGGAAGTYPGGSGGNGSDCPTIGSPTAVYDVIGGGGGGGGAHSGAPGGAGGFPGGGGGAGGNVHNSGSPGAGGAGAPGIVVVFQTF